MQMITGVVLCWCACALAQAPKIPRFQDYPVKTRFTGEPAKPQFTNPKEWSPGRPDAEGDLFPDADGRYRGSVELDAAQGPNFAGHYTIAKWSCGTGCS